VRVRSRTTLLGASELRYDPSPNEILDVVLLAAHRIR